MTRIKTFFQSQKAMKYFVLLLFVMQPVFDLDYLIYPFLNPKTVNHDSILNHTVSYLLGLFSR